MAVEATSKSLRPDGDRSAAFHYIELISWVATAVGIFLTFFQLAAANIDRRTGSALSYAESFSTGDLGDFRRLLTKSYLRNATNFEQLRTARATDEAVEAFVMSSVLSGESAAQTLELRMAVLEIADMFDQIYICIESRSLWTFGPRCDRSVVKTYFCEYAISFYDLYHWYLDDVSARFGSELGTGVKALAEGELCAA
ncbi:hypothetical protein [Thalassorhabdomicrobium marinisediminis]|uniref:DUF4760 domain-containing protein n=1 Tax=Thalassorhabdomicrobium marinisediminis TaxID=2170577 RepID=A0A2T7FY55_9RHOB|nr:hypothetical protein [Thalassorhabdomicrobium marinisediminis]PVA07093.1 hypothetical protein DC363_08130 [Thalassorhabdomicrobium marinisediminis]